MSLLFCHLLFLHLQQPQFAQRGAATQLGSAATEHNVMAVDMTACNSELSERS